MYIYISVADDEGQFLRPASVEVKNASIYGFSKDGMVLDIKHLDGEDERCTIPFEAYGEMTWGKFTGVYRIMFQDTYPPVDILTKDEFRKYVGYIGARLNAQGHFGIEAETL